MIRRLPAPFSRRLFLSSLAQSALAAPASALAQTLLALPPAGPVAGANPVTFTDITSECGLDRARNVSGAPQNKRFLLEEMGCGVAFIDYDNDGWLDIFLVNGATFDESSQNQRPASYLFRNNRDGTFTDVTGKAGLTHSGWGQACCAGD